MEVWSFVLSIVALAVSIVVAVANYRQNERLVKIEEERREEEVQAQDIADVQLEVISGQDLPAATGSMADNQVTGIRVENKGPGLADSVRLEIQRDEGPSAGPVQEDNQLLGEIGANEIRYATFDRKMGAWTIILSWDDVSGAHEQTIPI